jgi:hypothetical protein
VNWWYLINRDSVGSHWERGWWKERILKVDKEGSAHWKKVERERANKGKGELFQRILYSSMELSQRNPLIILMRMRDWTTNLSNNTWDVLSKYEKYHIYIGKDVLIKDTSFVARTFFNLFWNIHCYKPYLPCYAMYHQNLFPLSDSNLALIEYIFNKVYKYSPKYVFVISE